LLFQQLVLRDGAVSAAGRGVTEMGGDGSAPRSWVMDFAPEWRALVARTAPLMAAAGGECTVSLIWMCVLLFLASTGDRSLTKLTRRDM
jgi:hypothetical protein